MNVSNHNPNIFPDESMKLVVSSGFTKSRAVKDHLTTCGFVLERYEETNVRKCMLQRMALTTCAGYFHDVESQTCLLEGMHGVPETCPGGEFAYWSRYSVP